MSARPKLYLTLTWIPEDIILSPADAAKFLSGLMGDVVELDVLEDHYGSIIVGPEVIVHTYDVSGEPIPVQSRHTFTPSGREQLIELLTRFILAADQLTTTEGFTV
jgi:hypothetical protein